MVYISNTSVSRRNLRSATAVFAKDEGGAIYIFGMLLFMLMAMMGGLAVDIMHYETT